MRDSEPDMKALLIRAAATALLALTAIPAAHAQQPKLKVDALIV